MKKFDGIFIEGTVKTPQIEFNHLNGELILSGRSIPENAAKVYEPLLVWINEYVKSPYRTTNFRLKLEYFNSATSLWLAKMIKALSKMDVNDAVLLIHLYFDIEDFENMDIEELNEIVWSLVGKIKDSKISIGMKTYGTDMSGKIVKESTILI
jgi:hypothetical protein